jgi:hypothetical protein
MGCGDDADAESDGFWWTGFLLNTATRRRVVGRRD